MKFSKVKYYDSIDFIPAYRWFKLHETENHGWLLIEEDTRFFTKGEDKPEILKKLTDDLIDAYGLSQEVQSWLTLQTEHLIYKLRAIYDDKVYETDAAISKKKQELIKFKETKNQSYLTLFVKMNAALKLNLNAYEVTLSEFYEYLKILQNVGN